MVLLASILCSFAATGTIFFFVNIKWIESKFHSACIASLLCSLTGTILLFVYVKWNDSRLAKIPATLLRLSSTRITKKDVYELSERMRTRLQDNVQQENGRTGRRYIIVGGSGFLGGWIAAMLLDRGEDPKNIRILDFSERVVNHVTKAAIPQGLEVIKVDVTNKEELKKAFLTPWPSYQVLPALTVFHTAAVIRFYERFQWSYQNSTAVNVDGTANVLEASVEAGADVFVYTSSGNVGIKPGLDCLLDPRQSDSDSSRLVQILDDTVDEGNISYGSGISPQGSALRRHADFVSNYAASKAAAERLVRAANKTPIISYQGRGSLRTGCLRHGNCLFGPRGDMFGEAYLKRGHNPVLALHVVQSFTYVENAVEAHLCYEKRLIESAGSEGNDVVDISGQAFIVADSGAPTAYQDAFTVLDTLANGATSSTVLSLTCMMIMAYIVETWYTCQQLLVMRLRHVVQGEAPSGIVRGIAALVLKVSEALAWPTVVIQLQPSLFNVTAMHVIVDDSRARLPPEQGGLGYFGRYTTLEGLWKTWYEWDQMREHRV